MEITYMLFNTAQTTSLVRIGTPLRRSAQHLAPVAVVSAKVDDGKRELLLSYTWESRNLI
eukprot:629478-Prorocentrum_minimum.AAC.1